LAGCFATSSPSFDIEEDLTQTVNVEGAYDWVFNFFTLEFGTITFAQDGATVTATHTFHAFPTNRELSGQAELEGNRLVMAMTPKNGDTDYTADVTLLFSSDGSRFLADFADTNGDAGRAFGERQ
jgi:hypothetical protein